MAANKKYRSIIVVEEIHDGFIYVLLPAWNTTLFVPITLDAFPENLKDTVEVGKLYIVLAMIGNEYFADLNIEVIELAPEPYKDPSIGWD